MADGTVTATPADSIPLGNEIKGVLGNDSTLIGYTVKEATWVYEMTFKFVMNHAPYARLIARPVGQQSSAPLLFYVWMPLFR